MPASVSAMPRAYPAPAAGGWSGLRLGVVEQAPPNLVQAIGARVWSDGGVEYVDFDNAGGAVLLGHRHPAVIAAVRLARSGEERRGPQRFKDEVSARLKALAPAAEACLYGANAAQALRAALQAARIATGRSQVFACRSALEAGDARRLAGPSFPSDDLPALERLMDAHGGDTAALVLAPCAQRSPDPGYLAGVRALATRVGAVLVFDETLSGFRVHEGGAQALCRVQADLMVYGESLANGMPLGVLAGRRELVSAIAAAEPLSPDIASLAAARAVLARIALDPVIATLRIGGAEIQAEAGRILAAAGLGGTVELAGDPAASRLVFSPGRDGDAAAVKSLWMNECRANGRFTLGAVNMSYAHGEGDIAVLLAAFDRAADRLATALGRAAPSTRPGAAQTVA